MPVNEGEIFAGFRIIRLLGSGGMGEVYLAQHPRLPRRDALKILRADVSADAEYRARFNREADLASNLWHPHIVSVHDRGEYNGQLWISMDFVDGQDAARLLVDRFPAGMPVEQVVRIVTAVASALDYAHKQGLLHRDVKPANIMLTHLDDDGEQRILLADFGIARNVDDIGGLTTTNMTVGTVAYAAPEQLMGEDIDGRADQYALAATAYHLLTGSQLFPHSNPAVVISRHLNSAPPALADTRADLAKLDPALMKALAKNPAYRYARCTDFARALAAEPDTRSEGVSPTAATRPAPTSRPVAPSAMTQSAKPNVTPHSPSWLIPVVVAAALILMAGVILVWRPWSSRDASTSTQAGPAPASTAAQTTTTTVPSPLPSPSPPRSEAPTTSATTTVPTPTTTVTPGATLGLECADHHKIVYDPTTGQEITCFEVFSPSYGWFWQALSSTAGVHIRGTSCEGQRAWSSSRTPDGYMITCQPADIVSANPIAGPGSLWSRPENI